MDGKRLKRRLWIGFLLGLFVFAAFGFWGDFQILQRSFTHFEWSYVPLLFGLTFLAYILRFIRWEMFLRSIGIRISIKNSLFIFFSGMSMAITPGKAGELLKSFLLKSTENVDIARTAPVVFVERLTDLFAMILLASLGIARFSNGLVLLAFTSLVLISAVLLIQNRRFCLAILHKWKNRTEKSGMIERLEVLYESSYQLLRYPKLLTATLISAASWFLECLSFYAVFQGFGLNQSVLDVLFIFSFASIAGAVSMLPGGLGVAETSMTGLLMGLGIEKSEAIAATLMGRFATLWFGVVIGFTVLLASQKKWLHSEEGKQLR